MKIISGTFREILNLLKQVPLFSGFPVVDADAVEVVLAKTEEIINAQSETIRVLEEANRLREEDSRKFPNLDFGILVAKDFLLRSLQMQLDRDLYIESWGYELGTFQKYQEDARGGKGFFEIKIHAVVKHCVYSPPNSPETHLLYAHLHIACHTIEHYWEPNHCGSYICVDGEDCFEVTRDYRTGNIAIGKEGYGSHVPDSFRAEAMSFSKPLEVSAG